MAHYTFFINITTKMTNTSSPPYYAKECYLVSSSVTRKTVMHGLEIL